MSKDFDDEEDDAITVMVDYTEKVNITRFLNGSIVPTRLAIRAEVLPSESIEEIDFDIIFTKIKFWFENIVTGCIIFCKDNDLAIDMLIDKKTGHPRIGNQIMITPYEPSDDHLAVLFQSKMAALANGKTEFGCIRVRSDSSNGLVFTYVGDWQNDLPEMKDWFTTTPYYFETPWWTRDDVSMLDIMIERADVESVPPWAFKLDFIEQAIRPKSNKDEGKKSDVVIKFKKPKIIEGGEDE